MVIWIYWARRSAVLSWNMFSKSVKPVIDSFLSFSEIHRLYLESMIFSERIRTFKLLEVNIFHARIYFPKIFLSLTSIYSEFIFIYLIFNFIGLFLHWINAQHFYYERESSFFLSNNGWFYDLITTKIQATCYLLRRTLLSSACTLLISLLGNR